MIKIAFNMQGTRIMTASKDKTVKIWDLLSTGEGSTPGTCFQTLEDHTDEVFCCGFNYKGDKIVTGNFF
jgi:dynein assembly factor with WDR repeat domains 1